MKKILILVVFIASFATISSAVTFRGMGLVHIYIDDSARNGCWTNILEARNYIEGSVVSKGGTISRNPNVEGLASDGNYRIVLSVVGSRLYSDGTGPCYGTVVVRLDALDYSNADPVWLVFDENWTVFASNDNLNNFVLDRLSDFLKKLK
ncbi:hypothetical protein N9N92_00700 [Planktomarina temperata]|nr:hypothetical protein [Planktomarina temperata]